MTAFSPRFALPLAVALALATAAVHGLRAVPPRDECPSQEALLDPLAFQPPLELIEEGMRSSRIERGRLTAVWTAPSGGQYPVAIVRSHGLPNLLLQPPIALPGRNEADDLQIATLETDAGPLPVHYAYERRGREVRVTAYLLGYRGEAVASPITTRLREGPSALVHGSFPITIFAAAARGHLSQIDERRAELDIWLSRAWSHYQHTCGSGAAASS